MYNVPLTKWNLSSNVFILLLKLITHQFPFNQIRRKMNRECWIWKNGKNIGRNQYLDTALNKLIDSLRSGHAISNTFSWLSIIRCRDQYIATSIWKWKNTGVWNVWVYYGICVCHTIHMETYKLQKYILVVILISFYYFQIVYTCIMSKTILTFSLYAY